MVNLNNIQLNIFLLEPTEQLSKKKKMDFFGSCSHKYNRPKTPIESTSSSHQPESIELELAIYRFLNFKCRK